MADGTRGALDGRAPVRVAVALPAGGGRAGGGRAAGRAGVRAGRRGGARPGMSRAGRVPGLVGGCARLVRHHRGGGHPRVPARRARGRAMAGDDRRAPRPAGRRPLPGRGAGHGARRGAAAARRPGAAGAAGAPGAAGAAGRARPAVARGRPARAHRALGRRADRPRAGRPRGRARPGLPRGHRPQHGQPPRGAGAAWPGGTGSRCCPARR